MKTNSKGKEEMTADNDERKNRKNEEELGEASESTERSAKKARVKVKISKKPYQEADPGPIIEEVETLKNESAEVIDEKIRSRENEGAMRVEEPVESEAKSGGLVVTAIPENKWGGTAGASFGETLFKVLDKHNQSILDKLFNIGYLVYEKEGDTRKFYADGNKSITVHKDGSMSGDRMDVEEDLNVTAKALAKEYLAIIIIYSSSLTHKEGIFEIPNAYNFEVEGVDVEPKALAEIQRLTKLYLAEEIKNFVVDKKTNAIRPDAKEIRAFVGVMEFNGEKFDVLKEHDNMKKHDEELKQKELEKKEKEQEELNKARERAENMREPSKEEYMKIHDKALDMLYKNRNQPDIDERLNKFVLHEIAKACGLFDPKTETDVHPLFKKTLEPKAKEFVGFIKDSLPKYAEAMYLKREIEARGGKVPPPR